MGAIEDHLEAGERLVWTGRPQQGLRLVGRDALLVPVSALWTAGAVNVAVMLPSTEGAPEALRIIVPVVAGVFIAAGLYMSVGRLIHDAWLRSRMEYGLTDRRALILAGRRLTTADLATAEPITLEGGADGGRGTIRFGPKPSMLWFWPRMGWYVWLPSLEPTPQFMSIEGPREVFALARGGADCA